MCPAKMSITREEDKKDISETMNQIGFPAKSLVCSSDRLNVMVES